ncbi:MAG: TonB-dependent receptor [Tannerella sp.]|jgi:TonB-linked SusC/RagA family outer membrane protein|nr:TonB-dependent receptor [Tannerella sp.]
MTKKLFKGMKIAKIEKQMRIMMLSALFVMAGTVMTRAHSGDSQATAETQQSKVRIAGTVIDRNGDAVIGANIVEKNVVANGTTTDVDGKFSLSVSPGATLVVSYIGYVTQEIAVGNRTELQITLQEDLQALDEVVVVGYGTQKKVNMTGAVDMVSYDQIKERPVSNVTEALQGASPNLNIAAGEYSAEPGGTMSLNIRGVGSLTGSYSPYVLVDGMPMDLNIVNPNDIESISILKDAAASAIYGARAPYGVILVTTKKGAQGEKARITYSNNTSFSSPLGMPHMENTLKYMTAHDQASVNAGMAPEFTEYEYDRVRKYMAGEIKEETWLRDDGVNDWHGNDIWDIAGNANHDWFYDVYYRNSVMRQKHDASVSGGGKSSSYYASAGYLDQPGELRYGDEYYKRYNITANLTSKPTDWLTFIVNSKYVNAVTQHFNAGSYSRQTQYHNFYRTNSFRPMYLPNGTFSSISYLPAMVDENAKERNYGSLYQATLGAIIEPVRNWKTQFNYNFKTGGTRITNYHPTIYGTNPDGDKIVYDSAISDYQTSFAKDDYTMFNLVSSYEFSLKDHYFYVMGGFEKEQDDYSYLWSQKRNILVADIPSISTAVGEHYTDDNMSHWATAGFFGRLQYNYKEKYLFEANARYDGSSRFEETTRWGFFPSFSVGYNVSRESFWKPIEPYVNSLKIRASWGSLGNQNVPNYLYLPNLGINTNSSWIMGSERPSYSTAPALVSANLTWETSTTSNIGIDAGFLGNRLNAGLDVYRRLTTDMFGPAEALPILLGASVPQANNATLETTGFELVLNWRDRINDISYNIKATLSDNVSTVKKYNNPTKTLSTWYEGMTLGEIWGLETVGIYQTDEEAAKGPDQSRFYPTWGAGDIQYKDLDGDGKITNGTYTKDNPGDYTVIGNNSPRFSTGLTLGGQWKGFDLSMFWQGVLKRDYAFNTKDPAFHGFNANSWWDMNMWYKGNSTTLDYWRPTNETNMLGANTGAYYPKPYLSSEDLKNRQVQSRFTQNAAYFRLKNLTVGYTVPSNFLKKIFVTNARIYVSGENLLTFTSLTKLIDPEALLSNSYGTGKVHFLRSVYSVGLDITF